VNTFNYSDPKKSQYLDWKDPDIQDATGGAIPSYKNPELDERWGAERRHIAGGGHIKGVIEKCTFCVQRVEKSMDPACVETCPVGALTFGDIEDPESAPSKKLREKRAFRLLEEQNTNPSVFYIGTHPTNKAREIERPKARR
jgi:Fe-S-cluster-containing dehydrogenase component